MATNTILRDEYKGYTYEVRVCGSLHCGYVRLPKSHKYNTYNKYDDINDDLYSADGRGIHGGLTYMNTENDGYIYIGWDYAHYKDCDDPEICLEESKQINYETNVTYLTKCITHLADYQCISDSHFYTKEEVADDCMDMIDQLIEKDQTIFDNVIDAEIVNNFPVPMPENGTDPDIHA